MITILILYSLIVFSVGYCVGFSVYAIMLRISVRAGQAFAKDKLGKWQPFNPYEKEEHGEKDA